ncbi:MAG: hypothetical protein ACI4TK_19690 [Agathobacter sp.]
MIEKPADDIILDENAMNELFGGATCDRFDGKVCGYYEEFGDYNGSYIGMKCTTYVCNTKQFSV